MNTIKSFLAPDHQRCDDLFASAEAAAAGKEWNGAAAAFGAFREALEHHFAMEEEAMFPAFESRTGSNMGPTQMMRTEHEQMKGLLADMADAVEKRDGDAFLGDCETLLIIMQQHNIKEEQILYPMADQVLATEREDVIGRMRAVG